METVFYIILGLIGLALAIFLLKLVCLLCGLSVVLGFITWLIFDSFWIGAGIGGVLTLILIISDPEEFFDNVFDDPPTKSSSSSSSSSSEKYIRTSNGDVKVIYEDSDSVTDEYGHKWKKKSDGSFERYN